MTPLARWLQSLVKDAEFLHCRFDTSDKFDWWKLNSLAWSYRLQKVKDCMKHALLLHRFLQIGQRYLQERLSKSPAAISRQSASVIKPMAAASCSWLPHGSPAENREAIQGKTINRLLIVSCATSTTCLYLSIWHTIIWSSWGGLIISRPVADEQQGQKTMWASFLLHLTEMAH